MTDTIMYNNISAMYFMVIKVSVGGDQSHGFCGVELIKEKNVHFTADGWVFEVNTLVHWATITLLF